MNTGDRIKNRRKELGISADKLAEALGVSRSTIFRYENGDIEKLPTDVLKPVAAALHATPYWLLGIEEDKNILSVQPSAEALEVAHAYDKAEPKDQLIVRTVLSLDEHDNVLPLVARGGITIKPAKSADSDEVKRLAEEAREEAARRNKRY